MPLSWSLAFGLMEIGRNALGSPGTCSGKAWVVSGRSGRIRAERLLRSEMDGAVAVAVAVERPLCGIALDEWTTP